MNNYIEINNKIFETFDILRNYPLMILSKDDKYLFWQNYIEGFIDGLSLFVNKNVRTEITKWYKEKFHRHTSYHWTADIPLNFKRENEDTHKNILLDITEDYFIQNPDWYLD